MRFIANAGCFFSVMHVVPNAGQGAESGMLDMRREFGLDIAGDFLDCVAFKLANSRV